MKKNFKTHWKHTLLCAFVVTTITACSSDSDTDDEGMDEMNGGMPVALLDTCDAANAADIPTASDAPMFAFASSTAPDFSSGRLERIAVSEQPELSGCTPSGGSDVVVTADGLSAFAMGRSMENSLTKFDTETLDVMYQYSLVGTDSGSANPHDVAFLNDNTAYIARYDTSSVWVVNPMATSEQEFYLRELDLSAYDADGATEMTGLEIVGDKLFVVMQRLQTFSATLPSYVAVFDLTGDTEVEITTGAGSDGLAGIELPIHNVQQMYFNEGTNDLIITGNGDPYNPTKSAVEKLDGGVAAVDVTDYSVELLVDDNVLNPEPADGEELMPEFFSTSAIVSADKGYIVSFTVDPTTFASTSYLRAFNPTTGVVSDNPVDQYNGANITTISVAPSGNLWIGINDFDEPGFERLDPSDDSLVGQRVRTELNPNAVVFVTR